LKFEKKAHVNVGPGLAYPIRDGIPVMLEEETRQLSNEEIEGARS